MPFGECSFTAVLDACVLIPMPLADTLLRLAGSAKLYVPKWTDEIMAEVERSLRVDFGLTKEQVAYRSSEMRRHFPEAWINEYSHLAPAMTKRS